MHHAAATLTHAKQTTKDSDWRQMHAAATLTHAKQTTRDSDWR